MTGAPRVPEHVAEPLRALQRVVSEAETWQQQREAHRALTRLVVATVTAGWSQHQVAAVLGVSQPSVHLRILRYRPAVGDSGPAVRPPSPSVNVRGVGAVLAAWALDAAKAEPVAVSRNGHRLAMLVPLDAGDAPHMTTS